MAKPCTQPRKNAGCRSQSSPFVSTARGRERSCTAALRSAVETRQQSFFLVDGGQAGATPTCGLRTCAIRATYIHAVESRLPSALRPVHQPVLGHNIGGRGSNKGHDYQYLVLGLRACGGTHAGRGETSPRSHADAKRRLYMEMARSGAPLWDAGGSWV